MSDNQSSVDWIRMAQSYKDGSVEVHRLACAHRNSDSVRLVWYVAICGYVLVNGVTFLNGVLPSVTPRRIFAVLIPWALAAILSVVGHVAIARAAWREDRYHLGVLASLEMFAVKAAAGQPDGSALLSIVNDTDPKLQPERAAMDSANRWRRGLIQVAQVALLISFLWSTVALVFSGCLLPRS